jgi:hypothetical protein
VNDECIGRAQVNGDVAGQEIEEAHYRKGGEKQ